MKQPRGAAGQDLIFFILFLIVLGIVWTATGGPNRSISHSGPFLSPSFTFGTGGPGSIPKVSIPKYSTGSSTTSRNSSIDDIVQGIQSGFGSITETASPYAGKVTLSAGQAKNTNPTSEYVTLKTSKSLAGTLTVTGWRIESTATRLGSTIGGAAYLPISGVVNGDSPVALSANNTLYIVTGRPPTGFSFRGNECSGYFEQFQDFSPKIPLACPTPMNELKREAQRGFIPDDGCIDYVEKIRTCQLIISGAPASVNSGCQHFIYDTLTYNGCVNAHKTDADFYTGTWYVYLGRTQELWKSAHERIRLLDENGKVVASVSY